MFQIQTFTFNPFYENTYILSTDSGECILIDPGMYTASEQMELSSFLELNRLKPVILLNTHCHIDHIFGNAYCASKWDLGLHIHRDDLPVLDSGERTASLYGLHYQTSPQPTAYLNEGDIVRLGSDELKVLHLPGHSPGSIGLYCEAQNFIISGDVLFRRSIGRTDLPGGNHQTLLDSIKGKLMLLPDNTTVYSGHGETSSIGDERRSNPFLNG